jgi:hypothetical protein
MRIYDEYVLEMRKKMHEDASIGYDMNINELHKGMSAALVEQGIEASPLRKPSPEGMVRLRQLMGLLLSQEGRGRFGRDPLHNQTEINMPRRATMLWSCRIVVQGTTGRLVSR